MNGSTIKDLHAWQKCNLSLGFVILFNWDLFCIYICLLFIDSQPYDAPKDFGSEAKTLWGNNSLLSKKKKLFCSAESFL